MCKLVLLACLLLAIPAVSAEVPAFVKIGRPDRIAKLIQIGVLARTCARARDSSRRIEGVALRGHLPFDDLLVGVGI